MQSLLLQTVLRGHRADFDGVSIAAACGGSIAFRELSVEYSEGLSGDGWEDALKLIGVDVGFSRDRETTGIAYLDDDHLYVSRAGTEWANRRSRLSRDFRADVIALDGPLLPRGADELAKRSCEFTFIRGAFAKRCKPGLSHCGYGLNLRRAAGIACSQFSEVLNCPNETSASGRVSRDGPIVEAFPNAFLGVLLRETVYFSMPRLRRGKKFDWLYDRAVESGRLESATSNDLELPSMVWKRMQTERDHENRAALICLLTAGFAFRGTAEMVGDAESGWFCLPPFSLWQKWARYALDHAKREVIRHCDSVRRIV